MRYSESIQLMCETTDWCIVTNPKEDRTVICHHHVGFYINPSSKRGCHLYFPVAEFRADFGHRHEISKGQWWVQFFFLKVLAGMMLKKTRSIWFFETRQLKIHYLFGGFFHGKIINAWCPITMLDYRRVFFRFLEINTAKMNWKAKNDSTLPYFCEQDDSAADLGVPYFQTNPNNPSPVLRSLVLRSRTPEAPSEWWLWGKSVANLRAKWSLGRPPAFFFCCFKDIHPMIPENIFFKIPQVTKCLTSTQKHQCFETQLSQLRLLWGFLRWQRLKISSSDQSVTSITVQPLSCRWQRLTLSSPSVAKTDCFCYLG